MQVEAPRISSVLQLYQIIILREGKETLRGEKALKIVTTTTLNTYAQSLIPQQYLYQISVASMHQVK